LQSELGRGSTFFWTADFRRGERASGVPRAVERLAGLRALVVDDNSTNLRIIAEMLRQWGIEPVVSHDGASAFEMARDAARNERPFDMYLVDGLMPELDGFTLLNQMAGEGLLNGATIVMLSSADRQVFERKVNEVRL